MTFFGRKMMSLKGWLLAAPFSVFLLIVAQGCSGDVAVDQKLVNTFVELRLVEATYGVESPMARLARQQILADAGYSREKFLSKIDGVLEDERQWVPFQKAVNARIDSLLAVPAPSVDKPEPQKNRIAPPARKGGVE